MQTLNDKLKLYYSYKEAYYTGEPIVSDEEFDALENELTDAGYDLTLGFDEHDTDSTDKYSHRVKMLSLGKYQVQDDYLSNDMANDIWDKYGPGKLSWKYDGLALELSYTSGILTAISTRGNGNEGRNVFNKLRKLVPNTLSQNIDIDVRCEAVVLETTFAEKYATSGYSHSRNLAAGIVRDENLNDERVQDLYIVPLEAVRPDHSFAQIPYELIPTNNNENTYNLLFKGETMIHSVNDLIEVYSLYNNIRKEQIFGTDGLVYTKRKVDVLEHNGKYPKHAVSIKFKPPRLISTVNNITWHSQSSGRFVPKVHFDTIIVDGRKINKATGHNLKNLIDKNIKIGSQVQIVLSNDIIPMITIKNRKSNTVLCKS